MAMQQTTTTIRSSRSNTPAESHVRDARAMWSIAARIVDRCAYAASGAAPAAPSQACSANAVPLTAADLGFVIRMIQEADGYVDSIAKAGVLGDRTPVISEDQSTEDQSIEQCAASGGQGQGVLFKLMTQIVTGQNRE